MMRRMLPLLIAVVLTLQLAGCGSGSANDSYGATPAVTATAEATLTSSPLIEGTASSSPEASPSASVQPIGSHQEAQLKSAAKEVVEALRDRDLKRLSTWIDAKEGLRFSPYAHMDDKQDQHFDADALPSFKTADKLTWGTADGSGDSIDLSFRAYFEKYVYDQDFASAPMISIGKLVSKGNSPYNGKTLYPNSDFVEFHYPGFDSKLEGMDWESLILTFLPSGNDWHLVAITHAQWTV